MKSFSSAKSCNCSGESCASICLESASLRTTASGVEKAGLDVFWTPDCSPALEVETLAWDPAFLYKTLFSFSLTLSILFSTISLCTLAAPSNPVLKNQSTPERTVAVIFARSSARTCSSDLPSSSSPIPAPPAQRQRSSPAALCPYFLRRTCDSVDWRRDSAEERLEIEAARSRRRRAVEESMESRSGSVRWLWEECWWSRFWG